MALWLLWALHVSAQMPDMASMHRDLDRLAQVADPYSVKLTDQNFQDVRNGSMWVVNFCHPKMMHCKLLNVPWKTLAQQLKEDKQEVIIARVEPEDGLSAFRTFGVADVPSILVFSSGYVYNYTGKLEPRQLRELIANETYLMYDRRVLSPGVKEVRYWVRWAVWKVVTVAQSHPQCVAGTAGIAAVLVCCVFFCVRRAAKRPKTD